MGPTLEMQTCNRKSRDCCRNGKIGLLCSPPCAKTAVGLQLSRLTEHNLCKFCKLSCTPMSDSALLRLAYRLSRRQGVTGNSKVNAWSIPITSHSSAYRSASQQRVQSSFSPSHGRVDATTVGEGDVILSAWCWVRTLDVEIG